MFFWRHPFWFAFPLCLKGCLIENANVLCACLPFWSCWQVLLHGGIFARWSLHKSWLYEYTKWLLDLICTFFSWACHVCFCVGQKTLHSLNFRAYFCLCAFHCSFREHSWNFFSSARRSWCSFSPSSGILVQMRCWLKTFVFCFWDSGLCGQCWTLSNLGRQKLCETRRDEILFSNTPCYHSYEQSLATLMFFPCLR